MAELLFMNESVFQISGEDLAKLEHGTQCIQQIVVAAPEDAKKFSSIIKLVDELCTRIRHESTEIDPEQLDAASIPDEMRGALEELQRSQSQHTGESERLYNLKETDLMLLENAFPQLMSRAGLALNDANVQVLFEEIKEIMSNVRWGYGPPTHVEHHSLDREDEED